MYSQSRVLVEACSISRRFRNLRYLYAVSISSVRMASPNTMNGADRESVATTRAPIPMPSRYGDSSTQLHRNHPGIVDALFIEQPCTSLLVSEGFDC